MTKEAIDNSCEQVLAVANRCKEQVRRSQSSSYNVTVTFSAGSQANVPAADYRLRGLLKVALRRFGFRCVSVKRVEVN